MALYERLFPRFRPRREWRPEGQADVLAQAALRITWLGTAGFVLRTRETTLLIDPFLTRPSFGRLLHRFVPDEAALVRHLPTTADAILCGHSHYDHVADAPRIATLTGAKLVGSASTCAWGRAEGLAEGRLVQVPETGAVIRIGDVEVRFVPSRHGRIFAGKVPFPGNVHAPPVLPKRFWHYRMGGAFGLLIKTPTLTVYHNGSADLVDAELEGERADVLLACLAGRKGTENYVARLITALDPGLVVPTHHDAFFAPLDRGLHLLPGIDLDGFVSEVAMRAPQARIITPDYEEPICVPAKDARGAVLGSSPAR